MQNIELASPLLQGQPISYGWPTLNCIPKGTALFLPVTTLFPLLNLCRWTPLPLDQQVQEAQTQRVAIRGLQRTIQLAGRGYVGFDDLSTNYAGLMNLCPDWSAAVTSFTILDLELLVYVLVMQYKCGY